MKNYKNNSENVFNSITKKIVKEELVPVGEEILKVKIELKLEIKNAVERLEKSLLEFHNEVMNGIDQITTLFKHHEEELEILIGDHARIIKIEEYLKI